MIEWVLIHWASVALAILPLLAIHFCWGFRDHMSLWAWLFFGIFVAMFFASNSWAFVPTPEERTLEAAQRWETDVRLYYGIAHGWCAVAALGIAFVAAAKGQLKGAALLMLATVIAAMLGGVIEFSYCRLRDPVRYSSHIYLFNGGRNPACGRLAEFGIAPWAAWVGVWLTPVLTVVPSIVAMGWTARKKRGST